MLSRIPWLVFLLLPVALAAQMQPSGGPLADRFLARADSLRDRGQAALALTEADSLLRELDGPSQLRARIMVQGKRGVLLATLGDLEAAESAYRQALEDLGDADDYDLRADLHLKLSWVFESLGRRTEADSLESLVRDTAVGEGDRQLEAKARLRIGRRRLLTGRFDEAEVELRWSAGVLEEVGNHRSAGDAHNLLGILFVKQFRLEDAVQAFERTHDAAVAAGNGGLVTRTLTNMAIVLHQLGETDRAAAAFRESYDRSKDGPIPSQILAGNNVAEMESLLGHFGDAERLLLELLELARERKHPDGELTAIHNLGSNAQRWGRPREALAHYRQAADLARQLKSPEQQLRALVGQSRALADLDSVPQALALLETRGKNLQSSVGGPWHFQLDADRAGLLLQRGRVEESLELSRRLLARTSEDGLEDRRMGVQMAIADAHFRLDRPDSAIVWLRRAERTWEDTRRVPVDPEWRERRTEHARGFPVQLAQLVLEHGDGDASQRLAAAYDGLQRFKARTLLERMTTPGRELSRDEVAEIDLTRLQGGILAPGELLLDYYAGPEASLLFVISGDLAEAFVLPASEEAWERIELLSAMLASPRSDPTALGIAASSAFEDWMGRARERIEASDRILFSPDGPFHLLPLAIFTNERDGLLGSKEIMRVPSATILARTRSRASGDAGRSVLAIAGSGEELEAARREVESLASRYLAVETWGTRDEEAEFELEALQHRSLIHIAAHARVRDDNPWRSSLLLNGTGAGGIRAADRGSSSPLTADRIAQMRLDNELVFLAACESATGRETSGEGVLGLTSAFLSAGSAAVVATLWAVEDHVAELFVGRFYEELASGISASEALSQAREFVRSRPETTHPRHWAGYVVVGDGSRTVELRARQDLKRWYMGLPALILILALYLRSRIRKANPDPAA